LNIDLKYYFSVFLRRFHYFALVSALVSAVAVTAALLMPPKYNAVAKLLVESPQIPDDLAASTVQTGAVEQLQIVEQMLMTRANLLDIANRLRVFPQQGRMSPDEVVQGMHDATTIQTLSGKDEATLMVISFTGGNPNKTAKIVNDYVSLILQQNAVTRQDRAGKTLDFFQQQVDQLGAELDRQGSKILDFKNQNAAALPDSLEFRMSQQSILQDRVGVLDRDIASLNDQKNRLIAVFNQTGQVSSLADDLRTPEQKQLDALRDQLAQALAIYSSQNPRVKMLEAQIGQMEKVVQAQAPITDSAPLTSPLDIQLAEIDARTASLVDQKDGITKEIEAITASIDKTAANGIALSALERDHANIQAQYNSAVDRLSKAATGERIELLSQGQRISVIDQATVPDSPTSPNRMMIALGGVFGGVFMGLALLVLMELMNRSVRRPVDLVKKLGITPLAVLPYVRTKGETFSRRMGALAATLAVVLGVPAALYALHTYYLPLDLLVEQVMGKVGVRL